MVNYTVNDFDIKKLGSFYFEDKTIFRVFAPESISVDLIINNHKYAMHKNGYYFEIGLGGNLEFVKYYYENDRGITYRDPFAYYSDDKYSYVLNTAKFIKEKNIPGVCNDVILYELSVRDFSCDETYTGKYNRKFLALGESGLKYKDLSIGLDYIKQLGVSHIQLMPILDFDLDNSEYNWGYNPIAYNYVHKGYVYDKDNPYAYINELRSVVNVLHKNNIRVTIDVVFNHVYRCENFDLDAMLGGHVFRKMKDGTLAKGSLCGNEICSEDVFVRAYLIEMTRRYIELFDIDGIRIDQMGILDYETVNLIYSQMKTIKNDFIVYGEGWNMGDALPESMRAAINNASKMTNIFMFNDYYRDTIINYVCGNDQIREDVKSCLLGVNNSMISTQTLNYVECHDNYTFIDRLNKYLPDESMDIKIRRAKLALALVVLSKGIPFIHMGQEFLRTKKLIRNSYNCSEDINKVDWNLRVEHKDICNYLRDLIDIRKGNACFANPYSNVSFNDYYDCIIYGIDNIMVIINPCMWDHVYQDGNNYEVIFDLNGKNCYTNSVLSIPAYSILICKR